MANRPTIGVPSLSRRGRILIGVGAVALVLFIGGERFLATYVDWLWFGEVGFREVFSTVLLTRVAQFFAVGIAVGGVLAISLYLAYRHRPVFVPVTGPEDPVARYRITVVQRLPLFGIGVPVAVGVLAGLSAMGGWQTTQLFLNRTSFGIQDPEFGLDIGFYAFTLPFLQQLLSWANQVVVIAFIGALVTHYLFGGVRLAGRGGQLSGPARVQLAVLAGVFVLLRAVGYYLDRYELLFSSRSDLFTGATYTDLNAVLPAKLILLCIAVICAVAFFVGAVRRNLQLPAIATALLVLSSILVGAVWPALLQQFSVNPNANERERASIVRNIEATRQAYGITDEQVEYIPYSGRSEATPAEVRADTATVSNIRLLDPTILEPTFTQLQQRENFFGFPQLLDVDRYEVDGRMQDFVVAVRELETASLADNQRTWINQHLTYTHGNGFVAAPANRVNAPAGDSVDDTASTGNSGYPVFTVSDTTNRGAGDVEPCAPIDTSNQDIPVEQPRIYFGELIDDYVIVGGREGAPAREFDHQIEGVTCYHTYQGAGGVPMGDLFNRLVFAAYHSERNLLFNQEIGANSKIIYNQDPALRVEKAAPWLTLDSDPYPAVVGGRIQWIVDGYTTLENFPYAQRTTLSEAAEDSSGTAARLPDDQVSYIRNSVKATVDAYDGTVTLYQFDEQDPVLKAWMQVFPDAVTPSSEISDELRAHFRYPEDLFKVQREMLTSYHVDDPRVFFDTNDRWSVPTDPTVQGQTLAPQPAYYVLAGPPNASGPAEFQLTSALVGLRRQFLSAYVSVSADPENYGQFRVLELPAETQTAGPQQVQNRFTSDAAVSQELNLLRNQTATQVINGNLLTLPVGGEDGGLLYVEPIYVQRAENETSFPQLNRVLVFYGERIGYAPTLSEALDEVFGEGAGDAAQQPGQGEDPGQQPPDDGGDAGANPAVAQAIRDISAALQTLRSVPAGDFTAQGEALEALDAAVQRYDTAVAAAGGGAAPADGAAPGNGTAPADGGAQPPAGG